MNNDVTIDISGVPPLFVTDNSMLNKFFEEFKKKYQGKMIKEDTKYKMNLEIEQFKNELKEEYPQYPIVCRLKGPVAYHRAEWTLKTILELYQKHYPERYEEKNEYSWLDVNNMLFDLQMIDLIEYYRMPHHKYGTGNEAFDGTVTVNCRYFLVEDGVWKP